MAGSPACASPSFTSGCPQSSRRHGRAGRRRTVARQGRHRSRPRAERRAGARGARLRDRARSRPPQRIADVDPYTAAAVMSSRRRRGSGSVTAMNPCTRLQAAGRGARRASAATSSDAHYRFAFPNAMSTIGFAQSGADAGSQRCTIRPSSMCSKSSGVGATAVAGSASALLSNTRKDERRGSSSIKLCRLAA